MKGEDSLQQQCLLAREKEGKREKSVAFDDRREERK